MLISLRHSRSALLALALIACRSSAPADAGGGPVPAGGQSRRSATWPQQLAMEFGRAPEPAPAKWMGLIGEYGPDTTLRWIALERDRRMHILDQYGNYVPLAEKSDSVFEAPRSTASVSGELHFLRDSAGRATAIRLGDMMMARRKIEPPPGVNQLRITPLRPVEELRREALNARPPAETGSFKQPDLVELVTLDSTIKLEIRYATENNFLGTKVYEQPRAFMQRPAAEALAKANKALKPLGYGLLIHDAYRPWYVTKIFWDATPDSLRWLVANPAEGSRHNRGAAVDLTLYKLEGGQAVEMPSTYDESTTRAYASYPGGTALQRWYRALLKRAVEHEGFTVNPREWWHFDFKDWRSYPIGNIPFDQVRPAPTVVK
ncbi:MAG TPA: M15 family metallopeptidase [Gemmatimonadaceae bacterium]|nr:M15 family metallopeptidase [Gemmatimonadaceae bacterium]